MSNRQTPHHTKMWAGSHKTRKSSGLNDSDTELSEVLETMERCFAILQGHVREAEQTSASAVLDMTDRLRDVHERCQSLQQEWQGAADAFHSKIGDADSPLAHHLQGMTDAMNAAMQGIRDDLVNALGQMQFQDINRQLLEQVDHSLGNLGDHCHAWRDPNCESPTVADLEAVVANWMSHYVMDAQRKVHEAHSRPGDTGPPETDNPIRIELF